MAEFTPQMRALARVQLLYGKSAFTVDYVGCRQVGCYRGSERIMAHGQTWEEAIERLQGKMQ